MEGIYVLSKRNFPSPGSCSVVVLEYLKLAADQGNKKAIGLLERLESSEP